MRGLLIVVAFLAILSFCATTEARIIKHNKCHGEVTIQTEGHMCCRRHNRHKRHHCHCRCRRGSCGSNKA